MYRGPLVADQGSLPPTAGDRVHQAGFGLCFASRFHHQKGRLSFPRRVGALAQDARHAGRNDRADSPKSPKSGPPSILEHGTTLRKPGEIFDLFTGLDHLNVTLATGDSGFDWIERSQATDRGGVDGASCTQGIS